MTIQTGDRSDETVEAVLGRGTPEQREATLLHGVVTAADAEARFLSGGDPRALRSEPDDYALVSGPMLAHPLTKLLTPPGPRCC